MPVEFATEEPMLEAVPNQPVLEADRPTVEQTPEILQNLEAELAEAARALPQPGSVERWLTILMPPESADQPTSETLHHYREMLTKVVQKVVSFFEKEPGTTIEQIKPLAGGFRNPVLLVEVNLPNQTREMYVAKGFVEEASAKRTQIAQDLIDKLDFHGLKMIPKTVAWLANDVELDAFLQGASLGELLTGLAGTPSEEAVGAVAARFREAGALLGSFHKQTEVRPETLSQADQPAIDLYEVTAKKVAALVELGILDQTTAADLDTQFQAAIWLDRSYSLAHNDAHLGNFMALKGQDMVAMIDYEDATLADPMIDISRFKASISLWIESHAIQPALGPRLFTAFQTGYQEERGDKFTELRMDILSLRLALGVLRFTPEEIYSKAESMVGPMPRRCDTLRTAFEQGNQSQFTREEWACLVDAQWAVNLLDSTAQKWRVSHKPLLVELDPKIIEALPLID